MNQMVVVLAIFLAGCMAPRISDSIDASALCVAPGASAEQLIAHCTRATRITDHTEEGPLPAYEVSHGRYRFRADLESGFVTVLRFTSNPLPIRDMAIGDTFESVKAHCGNCRLLASADEEGYISLVDDSDGFYLSFDTTSVPTDWYFADRKDETLISDIRLVSVNFSKVR